ncbi:MULTISPECIES: single-stranded DNA-binding protein [Bacillaceae]|uniref:Single-stranded DNA-binding protein n=1 Tax=Evansella alkalicola TaxID=745819 RepID=A0ABS6JUN2_9BACI|nr:MULTISPECIES: single-stranded DNA-binding protein [Bacillaceae]MBU9722269.1 single-stranded DNA-binding protein [Bacillus alkalicola]
MLNQVMLIGRIAKDPVIQTTKEGTALTRISLAVRRPFKNNEGNYDTDFISLTAWKKLAETTADYCSKGSLVCVTGRVHMRTYDIDENKRITTTEIVAENITFLHLKRNTKTEMEVPIPGKHPVAAGESVNGHAVTVSSSPPPQAQQVEVSAGVSADPTNSERSVASTVAVASPPTPPPSGTGTDSSTNGAELPF